MYFKTSNRWGKRKGRGNGISLCFSDKHLYPFEV